MERILIFSLERQRPIRVIFQEQDKMKQATGIVTELTENGVRFRKTRAKADILIRRSDLLAADFRKGDEGQVDV